ncbi:MAG TPA: NAD(P)/FAD-dependent oxidoreductase [Pseudonocardiaceae bacterium]|jgi:cation diffusion facilitator CzcD-associated flavoprotein CzcO|nr:NAD(P)/FAD-dependent oxidoreductase [Pseudonocardiaceae bacterium]
MSRQTHHHVIVVGAGFAGLGMAIQLRRHGITDFVVLERAGEVGGTWRDNSYPGCACDVPAHLYSFSFELNPSWSRSFSGQREIWDYLRHCTDSYGVRPHIRFHHELLEAAWDHGARRWRVRTGHGELTSDVLVTGTGALSDPAIPRIPGLPSFQGTVFHSAQWNHDYDLPGRRVAVVGTGASAIQFVPQIQPMLTALTVFQRTPPWILPRTEREKTGLERTLYRAVPGLQRLVRSGIYWGRELSVPAFTRNPRLLKVAELMARAHLRRQVPDPALRAKLTPGYAIGCKRILLSNDYLPALTQPNVEVVASGVAEIGPDWVRAADGTRREVDAIIFGTGFRVTALPVAARIRGRAGRSLARVWSQGAQAHRGTTVTGFPNLFILVGPNTGLGHSSMIYMIECQVAYTMDALRYLRRTGATAVEVRPQAQAAYNETLDSQMNRTVWTTGGCTSWYLDTQGRNVTLWPTFTWRFRRATSHFLPDEYLVYQAVNEPVTGGEPGWRNPA